MTASTLSYIKNKVDKWTFQTPLKILCLGSLKHTEMHLNILRLMIHEATSWAVLLGHFPSRMGNKFPSGYFTSAVGSVSHLGARWWQYCPKLHRVSSAYPNTFTNCFFFTSFTQFSAVFCWAQTDPKFNHHFCLKNVKLRFNIFRKMSKSKNLKAIKLVKK